MNESPIWLNGILAPARELRIDPADRGFLLGDGVFETIRVSGGVVLHVERHFARLHEGAKLLRLNIPHNANLHEALASVVKAHGLSEGVLRLTVTRGPGPRGVLPSRNHAPTVMITGSPPPPAPLPGRVIIARVVARDAASPLSQIKSLNYLPSILARIEADERGADDAILLNHAGNVAESSAANLFLHRDGTWLTPRLSDGALPGIRRALLLEAGIISEAAIPENWLFDSNALCLGNSLGLRMVTHVEGKEVRNDLEAFSILSDDTV